MKLLLSQPAARLVPRGRHSGGVVAGVVLRITHQQPIQAGARFLKGRMGLERIALRTYEAFGPLLLLATLAMGLLTWMLLAMPLLQKWLSRKSPGKHPIKFAYSRVLDWLQEQITPLLPRSPPMKL